MILQNAMKHRRFLFKTSQQVIFRFSTDVKVPANLQEYLKQRIKATGPITMATFMKEALTNPIYGYYTQKEVFGKMGDFTTSPEISQLFGEMVGVWFVSQWISMGKPQIQLVELGPGRGTLMADIIRVFKQLEKSELRKYLSIHLVEVSDKLKSVQGETLQQQHGSNHTVDGIAVNWFDRVEDVPKGLSFFIAHEFFDALPVHLFRLVNGKWSEVLVNYSVSQDQFEYVLSPGHTAVSRSFITTETPGPATEICPRGAVVMEIISENILQNGGVALIVDYGEEGSTRHSIRGFKEHRLVDNILENAGNIDITANVDFSFLKKFCKAYCHGPVSQQSFLVKMGIKQRAAALLQHANEEQARDIVSSYEQLVSSEKMGEKFKFMAVTQSSVNELPGF